MIQLSCTVSHSGKQHAYQHALSLQKLGALRRFVTSSYYRETRFPDRCAKVFPRVDRSLKRRRLDSLDDSLVTRNWRFEIPELWHRNLRKDPRRAERAMFRRDADFDRWVAKRFADESDVFWGFQGSAMESLRAARAGGALAVCEFATAHVTAAIRLLTAEAERHPEWAATISNLHFPDWYRDRLEAEPLEADVCIAASGFTKCSLEEVGVEANRIQILPLGADVEQFQFRQRHANGPLKVLFVGGIGQRKGIKYLLEAVSQVNSSAVELRLLGPPPADRRPLDVWANWFNYLGRTDQSGVVREMHNADVLVLPSVFEGFGLVIVEAMATGMPVIASTHSCGPEVIREAVDGFVLEPDDVEGLAGKIAWCAENREQLVEMGRCAFERAQEFSWKKHRERLRGVLEEITKVGRRE